MEDESRDGLYCGFEGVVGAAVISEAYSQLFSNAL